MFAKLINYFASVRTEMSKVSWPTRSEVMESARIVLLLSVAVAIVLFGVDRMLSLALESIL